MIDQDKPVNGASSTAEPDQIHKALSLRHGADDRIFVGIYQRNGDGEFHLQPNFVDGIDAAQQVVASHYMLPDVGAIWSNLQKLQAGATVRSKETIEAYVNLLIDIDRRDKERPLLDAQGKPVLDAKGKARLEHINATDAEREVLLEQSYAMIKFLTPHFKLPIHADSGNGYHLEYPLAPLAPGIGHQYHETILKIIKAKFERPDLNMAIDTTISNHTRVITVWNTWNRKYPHTPERPQRQTKILSWPKHLRPLSENALDSFCLENKVIVTSAPTKNKEDGFPEVDPQWLEDYGVEHLCEWGMPFTPLEGESYEKGSETHYRLGNCITSDKGADGFYQHHQGGNKRQTELILGKTLGIKCFSNDCDGVFTFKDWRRRLEELKGKKYPHRIFLNDGAELAAEVFGAESPDEEPEPVKPKPNGHDKGEAHKHTYATGEYRFHTQKNPESNATIVGIRMSDIRTEKLEWLWPDKIPAGNVTLFGGQPGCGKSIVLLDIIARGTTGKVWANGIKNTLGPRDVLLLASEDGEADTIKPRLIAAGADMSRIIVVRRVLLEPPDGDTKSKGKSKHPFQLSQDISTLKDALKANPNVALVALDPISAFFGECDPNKDKEIRPVMEGIADAMEGTKCAFIGIIHNNKRGDADSISKILGASSVVGVARAVWGFSYDADDKTLRKMLLVKGNLSEKRSGMNYRLVNTPITLDGGEADGQPSVDWKGETDEDADDLLAKKREKAKNGGGGDTTMVSKMKPWVKALLEKGPRLATDMYRMGESEFGDDSGKTLKRAQVAIGGLTTKTKPYYWYLPEVWCPGSDPEPTPMNDTEAL